MLKIAVYHYRVPLSLVTEETGRKRFCGPPRLFVSDRTRRKRNIAVSNRGGKTIVEVTDLQDMDGHSHVIATGVSVCSMSDNFDYRVGARKALWAAKQVIFSGIDTTMRTHKEWDEAVDAFYNRNKKVVETLVFPEVHVASTASTTPAFVHANEVNWAGVQAKLDALSAYIFEATEVVGMAKKMAENAVLPREKPDQAEPPKKSRRKSKKKEA